MIAFRANNPGYWFLHCHIESHQLEGMAVLIQEYPESEHNPPPDGINNCTNFQWTSEEFYQTISGPAPERDSSAFIIYSPGLVVGVVLLFVSIIINILLSLLCCDQYMKLKTYKVNRRSPNRRSPNRRSPNPTHRAGGGGASSGHGVEQAYYIKQTAQYTMSGASISSGHQVKWTQQTGQDRQPTMSGASVSG